MYTFNTKEERKGLWDQLTAKGGSCHSPWIMLVDFNNVLHNDDRIVGSPLTCAKVCDFQQCIDACGLTELQSIGCKNTWSDNQEDRIFSKIDWTLVNGEWIGSRSACIVNFTLWASVITIRLCYT